MSRNRACAGLERLCRYVLRPPLAQEPVRLRDDGRVQLDLKTPWHDRTRRMRLIATGGFSSISTPDVGREFRRWPTTAAHRHYPPSQTSARFSRLQP
jgi:hypothetical protein